MTDEQLKQQLVTDQDFYKRWQSWDNDHERQQFWDKVWDRASMKHSHNKFVNGLYDYYQLRGTLTHRQFVSLLKVTEPRLLGITPLSERKTQLEAKRHQTY
jgi:hypothetical protein